MHDCDSSSLRTFYYWKRHVTSDAFLILFFLLCCYNSDGWDRTSQLVALSELLLDPFYRTILGFQILIEKEWLSFGHKFQQRIGHYEPRHLKEESPIFVMFMDCVWQIWRQFPCSFQFNENFLLTILEHLYSCRFGTFLFNCERDRVSNHLYQKTASLWDYINANFQSFLNPFYTHNNCVLYPVPDVKKLQLWSNYYLKWDRNMKDQENTEKITKNLQEKCDQLQKKLDQLQQQCL